MEDNSTKAILVLILIIIILGGILGIKVLNENNNETTYTENPNYSKVEVIDLIKSEKNKSNYKVEYTSDNVRYKIEYLDKKMKREVLDEKANSISYLDFEKNTNTTIDEKNKKAEVKKIEDINVNYISDDLLDTIEEPNCIIENEEEISNRKAIVLKYNGTQKVEEQFMIPIADPSNNSTNQIDEIKYEVKIWIDAETGLLLQTIMKIDSVEKKTVYDLKLNTVTVNDVTIPNLSQYKVTDKTSKQ